MSTDQIITSPLMDDRFNVMSYPQFLTDLKEKKFKKMSMTEIVNADMMIATFGEERYNRTCSDILATGNIAYKQLGLDHIIHVYCHNYKSFMAVANDDISDEDFKNLMKGFYEQYELANAKKTGLGGVSRFVLVFGDDLIDRGKSALYLNRGTQINFIIATDEKERLASKTEHSLRILDLLNHAISNDTIIPFYQGIHNNQTNSITKYEALMRVYDEDGNVCPPGIFLEESKRLKLYLTISKIMLHKALKDFEESSLELGLNISLFDIQSADFRIWFLERIKQHPNPTNITIEFVETENYNNNSELIDFLNDVRNIGCKIAVDDFGVGFATYSSIISLKPDIIKVDGDIIKNLIKNQENKLILDSICYMARLIHSKVVAEYVENEEIQKIVMKHNINYSQGYHFAKPEPLKNLTII